MEKQPLQSSEMISISSALYFPLAAKANSCKKALFSSPDFAAVLEEKSAEWRQEQGVSSNLPTLQDFYLTQDELVLLFPSPDTLTTLSFSIPLADLSGILSESLLSSLS